MTKRLDPEIKTLRAIARLLQEHDQQTRERIAWFFYEATHKGKKVPMYASPGTEGGEQRRG